MTISDTLVAAALAALMTLGVAGAATAQETAPEPRSESAISDDLLSAFVSAAINVSEVSASYRQQIDMAEDEATRQRLREEQTAAMVEAVEQTNGITVEEYVAIGEAAQADASLNQRITERLEGETENE